MDQSFNYQIVMQTAGNITDEYRYYEITVDKLIDSMSNKEVRSLCLRYIHSVVVKKKEFDFGFTLCSVFYLNTEYFGLQLPRLCHPQQKYVHRPPSLC